MFDLISKIYTRLAGAKKSAAVGIKGFDTQQAEARVRVDDATIAHQDAIGAGEKLAAIREAMLTKMAAEGEVEALAASRTEFLKKAVAELVSPAFVHAEIQKADKATEAERRRAASSLAEAKRIHAELEKALVSAGAKPLAFPEVAKTDAVQAVEHRATSLRNSGEEILTKELLNAAGVSETTIADCIAIASKLGEARREADYLAQRAEERKIVSWFTKGYCVSVRKDGVGPVSFRDREQAIAICTEARKAGHLSLCSEIRNGIGKHGQAIVTDEVVDITPDVPVLRNIPAERTDNAAERMGREMAASIANANGQFTEITAAGFNG